MEPVLLEIEGMFCTSCSRAVERVLQRLPGVAEARVGFATGVASIVVDASSGGEDVQARAIAAASDLGYPARPWSPHASRPAGEADLLTELAVRVAVGAFLGMWVMVFQLGIYVDPDAPDTLLLARLAAVFATPVVFVVGSRFHLAGWRTLRAGVPGMDALASWGSLGAWSLSVAQLLRGSAEVWFDAASLLVVFLLVGRLLEARARARGVDAVGALLDLTPETVQLVGSSGVREVVAATIEPGDRVLVPAGSRFPVDGTVATGRSLVDRAALTGESVPEPVGPGDDVEAGCTNLSGPLELQVTASIGSRLLDRIAMQVRVALDQRSEVQGTAEWLSERAVPVVVVLTAVTTLGVWLAGGTADAAVLRGLTVLVITCPCALGLAAPLVRVAAIGEAAQRGILFKDADALERAGRVERVAFDKTGTLTIGRPHIVGVHRLGNTPREALLQLAASAEHGSDHPLASALQAAAEPETAGERESVVGRGVIWRHAGRTVRVGSRDWLGVAEPALPGRATEVWVEVDGAALGAILLDDTLRDDAEQTVEVLERMGMELALWSGDADGPVERVAAAVGIPAWRSRMTPSDKAAEVRTQDLPLAFVGDGINDTPVLAAATVGIAVEGATDAARAAADVVVRAAGLPRVADALLLAREARRRARLNLTWALSYNALAVPVAMAGWIRPEWAALAMVLSSASVTLNASRPWPRLRGPRGGVGPASCASIVHDRSGQRPDATDHRGRASLHGLHPDPG
jgi:heavy metal translocating P-type ATPase